MDDSNSKADATISATAVFDDDDDDDEWTKTYPKEQMFNGTHYKLSGDENGELIVTFHGIDGFSYAYNNLVSTLINRNNNNNPNNNTNNNTGTFKKYRVLQYDMMGRGRSAGSINDIYTDEAHLKQIRELMEHLDFHKSIYHIIGLSMGGALAALYAEKYINEIASLTLLAPAGLMDLPQLELLRQLPWIGWFIKYPMHWSEMQQNNSRTFYDKTGIFKEREDHMFKMKHLVNQYNPHQREATWQCKLQFPLYGIDELVKSLASKEKLPIHLIFGDKDVVVPYEYNFNRWKGILEQGKCACTYNILPNAGHNILLEFPDESVDIIVKYLDSL